MEHAYQPAATDAFPTQPNSYIQDVYTTHVFKNVDNTPGNDLIISAHPNGIAFITLAPSHAACSLLSTTTSTTEQPGIDLDASLAFDVGYQQPGHEPSRKSLLNATFVKGRGPLINPDQPMCKLQLVSKKDNSSVPPVPLSNEASTTTPVNSSTELVEEDQHFLITLPVVKGILVEINQRILNLTGQALLKMLKDEYIAILELKPSEMTKLRELRDGKT
jgi:hypothetical protein